MQIAGSTCRVCKRGILLSREGKFCPVCNVAVHLTCELETTCRACGQPFQNLDHPKTDVLSDAVIPKALRTPRSGGPVFAVAVVLILVFVFILLLVITHGHAFGF